MKIDEKVVPIQCSNRHPVASRVEPTSKTIRLFFFSSISQPSGYVNLLSKLCAALAAGI